MYLNSCGVYSITNIINNKIYVGSSINIGSRFERHRNDLIKNKHGNQRLQRAWNKYGKDNFKFNILELVAKEDEVEILRDSLLNREQFWIDFHKCYNPQFGYNLNPKADSSIGRVFTEEHRRKLSEAHKGRKQTKEAKEKLSKALKGRPSKLKGVKISEEHRKNIGKSKLGFKHTPETVQKMKEKRKEQIVTEEYRENMRKAQQKRFKLNPVSEETREKLREKALLQWKKRKEIINE